MNFLRHSSTVCHNVGGVGDKLSKIAREGSDRFQIIADFDFTMTGYCERGTCFGAIRTYPGFSKEVGKVLLLCYKTLRKQIE